ncbi:MAG TPA: rhodanese-like domain-containing protein [Pseudacidobacterium sp.]|jgi:rhodanese-related sulfurtransferase|nr:rhodanese-like domain-containing protein [Pseudacidobacterium sp.]
MNVNEIKSKAISPAELSAILGTGDIHQLLDVRTPPEYGGAHVPGARLVPLNELKVEAFLAQHKPGSPIYILCQAGARASKAIEQFERAGCHDCVLVEGGTQAWIDAGLPVHRGVSKVLPLMRQVQIVVGSLAAIGAILVLTVNPWFAILPLFLGCGLLFAGMTGTCGMALMLARMPWNREQNGCPHCCT